MKESIMTIPKNHKDLVEAFLAVKAAQGKSVDVTLPKTGGSDPWRVKILWESAVFQDGRNHKWGRAFEARVLNGPQQALLCGLMASYEKSAHMHVGGIYEIEILPPANHSVLASKARRVLERSLPLYEIYTLTRTLHHAPARTLPPEHLETQGPDC